MEIGDGGGGRECENTSRFFFEMMNVTIIRLFCRVPDPGGAGRYCVKPSLFLFLPLGLSFPFPFPSLPFSFSYRAATKFKFGAVNESIFSGIWGSGARDKHERDNHITPAQLFLHELIFGTQSYNTTTTHPNRGCCSLDTF